MSRMEEPGENLSRLVEGCIAKVVGMNWKDVGLVQASQSVMAIELIDDSVAASVVAVRIAV